MHARELSFGLDAVRYPIDPNMLPQKKSFAKMLRVGGYPTCQVFPVPSALKFSSIYFLYGAQGQYGQRSIGGCLYSVQCVALAGLDREDFHCWYVDYTNIVGWLASQGLRK